jgi:hypothetical protein
MNMGRFETKVRWTALGTAALLAMWGCGSGSSSGGHGGAGGGAAAGGSASPGLGGQGGAPAASGGQGGAGPTGEAGAAAGGSQGAAGVGGAAAAAGSPASSGGRGGGAGGGAAGTGGLGGGAGTGGLGGGAGAGGRGGAGTAGSTAIGGAGGGIVAVVPQVTSLAPMEAAAGASVSLTVYGQGISSGWTVYFNGSAVPTTVSAVGGDTVATASFTIAPSVPTGRVPVWLASGAVTSNTVYFTVTPAGGAPTIVDYTPDNALPGTKISIVGTNFTSLPLTITDPLGRPVAIAGTGTTTWVGAAVDRVDIVIPSDMPSGALTATNSKGSFRGRTFNVGMNLVRLPGTVAAASTEFNTTNWSMMSGSDNNLQTSWFSAHGDCATQAGCTHVPTYKITFPSPQMVGRVSMRGNREYATGYDFIAGRFELLGASGVAIWSADRLLPDPDRDLDIMVSPPLSGVTAVRFTSTADESDEPGFSELEVFGP